MRLPGSVLQGILARSALTLLRIYLGGEFLLSGWEMLTGPSPGLAELLRHGREGSSPGWYQQFAEQIILPRVTLVATLIAWGELVLGCCLLLGLGTRLAAAAAFLLALNFLLAVGAPLWTPATAYSSWAMISLALLIGAAGRTMGLDAVLARRWPRSPFW